MLSDEQVEAKIDFNEAKKSLPELGIDKDQNVYPRVELSTSIYRVHRLGPQKEPILAEKIHKYILSNDLAYLYKYASEKGVFPFDEARYQEMIEKDVKVRQLLDKIVYQKDKYDESCGFEVVNYYANYLSYIGDRESALKFLNETSSKWATHVQKIEYNLHMCRIGFFYLDRALVRESLGIVEDLIKRIGDWHLKNIAYAYSALNCLWNRNIKGAAKNFLTCVSSFSSFDLMSLPTFCSYVAVTNLLALPREKFHQKVSVSLKSDHMRESIISGLCEAFYMCNYAQFTSNLRLLVESLKYDAFCVDHVDYLCREFRLIAYKQLLASFKSLTLDYLSQVFGISKDFIETDIASFIARGQLDCKIDLVREMVVVSLFDKKKKEFCQFLDESNRLIANIQFMERTVNE
ncbi:26S proteasome non-ATPase regulatory subunit 6 [Thelohanellus kitauei]|uniref:26S proteasome non-ATPase regulatory subunit 6 n=1 Tax=Thelohanellus kitauei TaxID=669202 RepID=A0A0C2MZ53_THEKT|nr:26S proteasome non-ATPase regulatory subunit 6 [Thelohanellus kitauei]